jgi:hypothetical protein
MMAGIAYIPIATATTATPTLSLADRLDGGAELDDLSVGLTLSYNGVPYGAVLIGGADLTVEFTVGNASGQSKGIQLILALHNTEGRMVGVRMQEGMIAPDATTIVGVAIPIPVNTEGLSLRVMIWDNSVNEEPHTVATISAAVQSQSVALALIGGSLYDIPVTVVNMLASTTPRKFEIHYDQEKLEAIALPSGNEVVLLKNDPDIGVIVFETTVGSTGTFTGIVSNVRFRAVGGGDTVVYIKFFG